MNGVRNNGLQWPACSIYETLFNMVGRKPGRRAQAAAFARILNSMMKERNMGVREAARISGVNPSTIVAWRAGAAPSDFQAIRKLAKALGATMSYLLTGMEEEQSEKTIPPVAAVFDDGGAIFDGYAKITIQRLIPKQPRAKAE